MDANLVAGRHEIWTDQRMMDANLVAPTRWRFGMRHCQPPKWLLLVRDTRLPSKEELSKHRNHQRNHAIWRVATSFIGTRNLVPLSHKDKSKGTLEVKRGAMTIGHVTGDASKLARAEPPPNRIERFGMRGSSDVHVQGEVVTWVTVFLGGGRAQVGTTRGHVPASEIKGKGKGKEWAGEEEEETKTLPARNLRRTVAVRKSSVFCYRFFVSGLREAFLILIFDGRRNFWRTSIWMFKVN